MRRVFGVSICTALFCTGVGLYAGLIGGLFAQTLPPAVISDKTGYFAGESVAITGSGFAADEVVTLQVTHADGTAEADAGHAPFTVIADAAGAFTASWTLGDDGQGHNFALRAAGTTTPALAPVAFNRIATVATSLYDYQPGDTAVITAAGFRPGESVTLLVEHSNGDNGGAGHQPFEVEADGDGRVTANWYVDPDHSIGSIFRLTAKGSGSGLIATSTFTDPPITFIDDLGPDDPTSGAQTDLSAMSVDAGLTAVGLTWNWDDTDFGSFGGNTGDACALVDTNNNGLADYAFCVQVDGTSATQTANALYSCNDTSAFRCFGSEAESFSAGTTSSASVVADSDPFRTFAAHQDLNDCDANTNATIATNALGCNRADTVANVTLQLSDVGGAGVAKLLNVCSYPSGQPNSNHSDCVVVPDSGFLTIVKAATPSDSTAFTFDLGAGQSSQNGTSSWTINGSGSTAQFTFAPGTDYDLAETIPAGWKLTNVACAIQTAPPTLTGTAAAPPAVLGPASAGVTNFEIRTGLETICTFTDAKQSGTIKIVKQTTTGTGTFTFTPVGFNSGNTFQLTTSAEGAPGAFTNFGSLPAGNYSVSEQQAADDGWDLSSSTCTSTQAGDTSTPASISLQDDETVTCTFVNVQDLAEISGQIIVEKQTIPDASPGSFAFTASYDADGFSLTDGQQNDTGFNVAPGTHSVSETVPSDWDLTATCTSSLGGREVPTAIDLAAGETVTCVFTNTKKPTLAVTKVVVNTGGGTKQASDFALFIDGNPVTSGVANLSTIGAHVVSETTDPDYTSVISGDCAANGNVTLAAGEAKSCTITNTFRQPSLTVTKVVVNAGGGTKVFGDFALFIDGNPVTSGVVNPSTAGAHVVSETTDPDYSSVISGDCAANGDVTLAAGETKSCTITNTFRRPKLTVTKYVVNNNGGTLGIANFPLFVDGNAVTSGVEILSSVGAHTVSETGNAGYSATIGGDCAADGTITLTVGDVKSCTIINDDRPPSLTLNKIVINDNDRNALESDFTLKADGALTDLIGPGAPGAADVVSDSSFAAGLYTLSETGPGGYSSSWACTGATLTGNQITLSPGQTATCTVTNNDMPFTLVTNSALCSFDRDTSTPQDDFRLLFTPDHQAPGYKQNASNPGQFYFNAFYTGTPGTTYTLTLIIPYPFVTQGARPVHVYDGATLTPVGGEQCITPANGVPITNLVGAPFALGAYNGGTHDLSDFARRREVQVTFVMPPTGTAYVNIHLDYGLKGTSGYGKDGSDNAVPNGLTTPVLIPDGQGYPFLVSDGVDTWDPSVYSQNEFKKNPGIGGLLATVARNASGEVDKWEPVGAGMTLEFFNAQNQKVGSTTTDVDGYYMWSFKHTGKAQTYTVKVKTAGSPTQVITIKANGFGYVTFELPSS